MWFAIIIKKKYWQISKKKNMPEEMILNGEIYK